jgi:glycine hydroxymethyltransferase
MRYDLRASSRRRRRNARERTAVMDGPESGHQATATRPTLPDNYAVTPLSEVDPEIGEVLERELERQRNTLEMIASENFVPRAVLEAVGSVLTNKYAEGYPGKRYYGGCEWVDVAERLAMDRAEELFGAEHANVQPHSGAQANNAVYMALLEPGDPFLGLALDHGGHLSHGMKLNVSGKLYHPVPYHVRREDSLVDMAHFAGLVAAGVHPNPVEYADVVTTTVHKTLVGPRSGMILCKEEYAKKINSAIFPGQQGGPLMHVIAAKAVAMRIAQSENFRARQRQTVANARSLAEELMSRGIDVVSGGTDVHLVLVDLTSAGLDGKTAEDRLEEVGITANRNTIPFDPRPPMNPSGLRIDTPALTTRGFVEEDMREIGRIIAGALGDGFESEREGLLERSRVLMDKYPLYPHL